MPNTSQDLVGAESSEESGSEQGYDSEAAEISKASRTNVRTRASKRRKLSHSFDSDDASSSDSEAERSISAVNRSNSKDSAATGVKPKTQHQDGEEQELEDNRRNENGLKLPSHAADQIQTPTDHTNHDRTAPRHQKKKKPPKAHTPGVIYLSSLPPYLRPSALRNLLAARGFSPITRLFLTPASTSTGSKQSRQRYVEGWIEFPSKHIAKECVAALNAQLVGGKKGGYYRDDLWNMRYLKGLRWEELMEGVRGERREREAREDEERRRVKIQSERFIEAVERGKIQEGMKAKQKRKGVVDEEDGGKQRWRQHDVKRTERDNEGEGQISEEARQVLAKIF